MAIDQMWFKERADDLAVSVLFLTRFRYGPARPIGGAAIARASWSLPIAGLLVGLVGALVYLLAHRAGLPSWPASALAVAATMLTTGCLHEDGLADTVDGFGGGKTRQQKLEIMRDSRIGTYGVCALIVSVLLRVSALASLPTTGAVVLALIAAQAAARAMLPAVMCLVPPARSDGLSFAAGQPPRESAAAAALLGIGILLLCLGFAAGIAALILALIGTALLAWLSLSEIGGQTGDVIGAIEQVNEIVVLLVVLG